MKKLTRLIPEAEQIKLFEDLKGILNGYCVESVAEASGVATSTLYFWLDGKTRKPRLDTIVKVADALGYQLQLVERSQPMTRPVRHLRLVK